MTVIAGLLIAVESGYVDEIAAFSVVGFVWPLYNLRAIRTMVQSVFRAAAPSARDSGTAAENRCAGSI
jgi:hypothetical protein